MIFMEAIGFLSLALLRQFVSIPLPAVSRLSALSRRVGDRKPGIATEPVAQSPVLVKPDLTLLLPSPDRLERFADTRLLLSEQALHKDVCFALWHVRVEGQQKLLKRPPLLLDRHTVTENLTDAIAERMCRVGKRRLIDGIRLLSRSAEEQFGCSTEHILDSEPEH